MVRAYINSVESGHESDDSVEYVKIVSPSSSMKDLKVSFAQTMTNHKLKTSDKLAIARRLKRKKELRRLSHLAKDNAQTEEKAYLGRLKTEVNLDTDNNSVRAIGQDSDEKGTLAQWLKIPILKKKAAPKAKKESSSSQAKVVKKTAPKTVHKPMPMGSTTSPADFQEIAHAIKPPRQMGKAAKVLSYVDDELELEEVD